VQPGTLFHFRIEFGDVDKGPAREIALKTVGCPTMMAADWSLRVSIHSGKPPATINQVSIENAPKTSETDFRTAEVASVGRSISVAYRRH
jgi:hypothetical protein